MVTHKLPSDMWLYQEILFEVRPSVVVEVGTRFGGATTFFADVMARVHGSAGEGWRVITVDIDTACDPTARNTPGVEVFTAPSASLRVSHARRPLGFLPCPAPAQRRGPTATPACRHGDAWRSCGGSSLDPCLSSSTGTTVSPAFPRAACADGPAAPPPRALQTDARLAARPQGRPT